jgi:low affinity Fe/Cu permease
VGVVMAWIVTGPIFGFSNTWQLVINTGTTIITFLMVFLIQNTQNRDTQALQIKLDELTRATRGAHNSLLELEELEEADLQDFQQRYEALATKARNASLKTRVIRARRCSTHSPRRRLGRIRFDFVACRSGKGGADRSRRKAHACVTGAVKQHPLRPPRLIRYIASWEAWIVHLLPLALLRRVAVGEREQHGMHVPSHSAASA